jgi:hypothetical protein
MRHDRTDDWFGPKKEGTMKQKLTAILVMVASTGLAFAQQPSVPKAGMEIDLPEVVAEVKAAYDRYNNAINSGTIAVLNDTFWNDPRTIRYGQAENFTVTRKSRAFALMRDRLIRHEPYPRP